MIVQVESKNRKRSARPQRRIEAVGQAFCGVYSGAGMVTKGREIKEKGREEKREKIKFFGGKTSITECIYRYVG